jgi:hypothetical protein
MPEQELERLKQELEVEARARDTVEWTNMELERNVRVMERSVQQLEAGSLKGQCHEIFTSGCFVKNNLT